MTSVSIACFPECPNAEDGVSLFACPTPDRYGYYRCIDEHALCDNKIHCPNGEDENKTVCMFHKTVSYSAGLYKKAINLENFSNKNTYCNMYGFKLYKFCVMI